MSREANCAYVILIMAIYWMTEALPMAVTALLPVVLMPWLDVASSKSLCQNYLKNANMLFFGGLMVAIAVEKWGLHKRVALRVLILVGSQPVWILFGFMSVTCFLSMWLSNTACAAMMIPIACAVLKELDDHRKSLRHKHASPEGIELQPLNGQGKTVDPPAAQTDPNWEAHDAVDVVILDGKKKRDLARQQSRAEGEKEPLNVQVDQALLEKQWAKEDAEFTKFACALKLCVAFAANVGGVGTLIGCGPNIVLKGQADKYGAQSGVDFTSWFIMCSPIMLINLILSWLSLVFLFIGPRALCKREKPAKEGEEELSANAVIRREYVKLGSMTFAEIMVMISFIVLALTWLSKKPGFFKGWIEFMPAHEDPYVTDSSIAITMCVLLFILPSQAPNFLCFKSCNKDQSRAVGPAPPLLDWPTVNKRMPWSVILLLGGGFALADACEISGLSKVLGNSLSVFSTLPTSVIVLILILIGTTFTTFTSNVATTTILLPITMELAHSIQENPLYLMIPVTISASYSYILPVSTPPNAIVYAYGDITMLDIIKAGLVNCAMHILVLMLGAHTWGAAFFDFYNYPKWAPTLADLAANATATVNPCVVANHTL